jgi:hypothetical protein
MTIARSLPPGPTLVVEMPMGSRVLLIFIVSPLSACLLQEPTKTTEQDRISWCKSERGGGEEYTSSDARQGLNKGVHLIVLTLCGPRLLSECVRLDFL